MALVLNRYNPDHVITGVPAPRVARCRRAGTLNSRSLTEATFSRTDEVVSALLPLARSSVSNSLIGLKPTNGVNGHKAQRNIE